MSTVLKVEKYKVVLHSESLLHPAAECTTMCVCVCIEAKPASSLMEMIKGKCVCVYTRNYKG